MRSWLRGGAAVVMFLAWSATLTKAAVINFDDKTAGNYSAFTYAPDPFPSTGVTFHTADIPNAISVGTQFTAVNQNFTFDIDAGDGGLGYVSSPNFAKAAGGGTRDLLMSFPEWVTAVSLQLDTAPEGDNGEIVRFIALKELGPATFEVLQFVEAQDHEAGKLMELSLSGQPFQWVVFQTTVEQEGIDNVNYTPLPEPAGFLFTAMTSMLLVQRSCRCKQRRRIVLSADRLN